ncbi:ERCC1 DNA repair endonuclease non-catalytic subunit Swi10 [Schizosaccharomyces osmophilus]|uniref:ERCC1 DNA repair endonuclease non-catalytic subunit Swi10 n=1 Tax=Schizosaccharomyces osmophilus TaxID=2545709 RepID=A0AAF0AVT9_9SCHI|nr:ERCC1 DNA repair endonuclease non-catalytic subunit Swi10 [Schizosaccharomyces osmophilus]WBW72274.1 ERCC1 DNA repair endonuclease non-catalytic subunit Swi10 [Schizosaccharomyces osmophilus]
MSDIDDEEFEQLGLTALEQVEKTKTSVNQPQPIIPQKVSRVTAHAILVNFRQKGNPLLHHVRNVPWEYAEIVPDFVMGNGICSLFLSLKYHHLHPEYIYGRISRLGKAYNLRVMLVLVDVDNHQASIQELVKTSIVNQYTLVLAWSPEEAARYLETYKAYEHVTPTSIMEKPSMDYLSQVQTCLTSVRGINKSDSLTLLSQFGSLKGALSASREDLEQLEGWGPTKVNRFLEAAQQPFMSRSVIKNPESLSKEI